MTLDYLTLTQWLVGLYVSGFVGGYLIQTFKRAANSVSSE